MSLRSEQTLCDVIQSLSATAEPSSIPKLVTHCPWTLLTFVVMCTCIVGRKDMNPILWSSCSRRKSIGNTSDSNPTGGLFECKITKMLLYNCNSPVSMCAYWHVPPTQHIHAQEHTHANARVCTPTHTLTDTHTHTDTQTHTHIYIYRERYRYIYNTHTH